MPVNPIATSTRSTSSVTSPSGSGTGWRSRSRRSPGTRRAARAAAARAPRRPRARRSRAATRARRPPRAPGRCAGGTATRARCAAESRSFGGVGPCAISTTDAQPSRSTLPRQSALVSPPPRIATRRPFALSSGAVTGRPATRRFCCTRYSMARCTPASSAPGSVSARWRWAPVASTSASWRARSSSNGDVGADGDAERELDALGHELLDPAVDQVLLELEVGDAVAQQPAGAVVALVHGHRVARARELLSCGEAGRPRADDADGAARAHARRAAA